MFYVACYLLIVFDSINHIQRRLDCYLGEISRYVIKFLSLFEFVMLLIRFHVVTFLSIPKLRLNMLEFSDFLIDWFISSIIHSFDFDS